jgi:hypothetical protein
VDCSLHPNAVTHVARELPSLQLNVTSVDMSPETV